MVLETLSPQTNFEKIVVRVANGNDVHFAKLITDEMEASAKARGTGIAKRSPEYVAQKMNEGKAVIAHLDDGTWVGFCYIEAWGHGKFVANSGLIVSPPFRKSGVATQIKSRIFNLSREMYPESKIFGLTTGLAVMKMNSELGYVPVTYSELTDDDEFWSNCRSCVNYDILQSKERKNCLCTGMLYDPARAKVDVAAPVVQADSNANAGSAPARAPKPTEMPPGTRVRPPEVVGRVDGAYSPPSAPVVAAPVVATPVQAAEVQPKNLLDRLVRSFRKKFPRSPEL